MLGQTIPAHTNARRPHRTKMLKPIPRLRTVLMILINAQPIVISPQPLLRQLLLPRLRLAPLLRALDFATEVLLFCFKLLNARAAIDVVEAELEDAIEVDATFPNILGTALRAREVFAIVQPEILLLCSAVEA
jgi:hypothetical protein